VSVTSYVFGIVSAGLVLAIVADLLRRRRVRERHALWWLVAGVLALLVAVFPGVLQAVADLVGIDVPTNLTFFVSIAVLFLVSVQHSAELTVLEDKTRTLAEHSALQDERIERLEQVDGSAGRARRDGAP